jgi:MFS family permease
MITAAYPPEHVQRALGTVYGFSAMGTALGPLVGGLLAEISWRWVFLLNVPLAAVVVVLLRSSGDDRSDAHAEGRMDWAGTVLVALGLVLTTFAVDKADEWGWGSARVVGLLVAGLALLVVFVIVEARITDPLLDLGLFRNAAYSLIVGGGAVANCAYVVAVFCATLYLQDVEDLSPATAALVFLALAGGAAFSGQLAGRLGRFPPDVILAAALAVGGVALLLMTASTSWALFVPAFALVGVGLGLGWAYASVGTQVVVAPAQAAVASGVTLTVLVALGGVAVAVAAAALDSIAGAAVTTTGPIYDVVRVAAVAALVAAVVVLVVGRLVLSRRRQPA